MKYLVEEGADPNNGLECAIYYEHESIIQYLLEKGANPQTGVQMAQEKGWTSMVTYLQSNPHNFSLS